MAATVFVLCALTSAACMVLLVRGYLATRTRLLLWSSLGFCALALNNLILVADRLVFPDIDLGLPRVITALLGVSLMLYGCICDAD